MTVAQVGGKVGVSHFSGPRVRLVWFGFSLFDLFWFDQNIFEITLFSNGLNKFDLAWFGCIFLFVFFLSP